MFVQDRLVEPFGAFSRHNIRMSEMYFLVFGRPERDAGTEIKATISAWKTGELEEV